MEETAKTLVEMDPVERFRLFDTVTDALRHAAGQAEDQGDTCFAANSRCLAGAIVGCADDPGGENLAAVELLLRQGVMLLHLYSNRSNVRPVLH
ncbi:Hypothetical protein NGAL_HAMBI1145_59150 [Neorhizobium galegae bv. officinalis]|uniref:Uncharacterized protein n=1 Tax=Neorhizobium galegae bv. officinalis TaxID=323656 RepID=A0A0T7G2L9_NEOGA|nr:hypothetical protein [Neorhizobium galegae]CDZ41478.1 Hypothetical protein NGAL_HAMBI1145_59150 [Neorhizobium galegae bv. officinalis]